MRLLSVWYRLIFIRMLPFCSITTLMSQSDHCHKDARYQNKRKHPHNNIHNFPTFFFYRPFFGGEISRSMAIRFIATTRYGNASIVVDAGFASIGVFAAQIVSGGSSRRWEAPLIVWGWRFFDNCWGGFREDVDCYVFNAIFSRHRDATDVGNKLKIRYVYTEWRLFISLI